MYFYDNEMQTSCRHASRRRRHGVVNGVDIVDGREYRPNAYKKRSSVKLAWK
jgi:hypothetical protein